MENNGWKKYAKILLVILIPVTFILYCSVIPSLEKEIQENKDPFGNTVKEQIEDKKQTSNQQKTQSQNQEEPVMEQEASSYSRYITKEEMSALNNALYKINSTHEKDLQKITSIFLESMGYPPDLIKVEYYNNGGMNYEGDIQAGAFAPAKGKLALHQEFATKANLGSVIGVIRHELDHFDKYAKLCKAIGLENFQKMYGSNLNRDFWQTAMSYANTNGFDKKKYLSGAVIMNEYTDITSFYQVFVEKANHSRNPFELTAYAFSDYVEDYYKIKNNQETSTKKVAKVFNNVDWQIYRIASKNKCLEKSRSAIFDYYFLRAMITYNPGLKTAYQNAVKNGNITSFWEECQKLADALKNNVLTAEQTEKLIKILNSMNLAMNKDITDKDINAILQLKYLTLKDAAKSPKYEKFKGNLIILLGINVNSYLEFLNNSSIENDGMKLKLLATKYWLSNTKVSKEDGSTYDFLNDESPEKIKNKITSERLYRQEKQNSGLSDDKYFIEFITKNQIFK